jgi:hypothetical protein
MRSAFSPIPRRTQLGSQTAWLENKCIKFNGQKKELGTFFFSSRERLIKIADSGFPAIDNGVFAWFALSNPIHHKAKSDTSNSPESQPACNSNHPDGAKLSPQIDRGPRTFYPITRLSVVAVR